MFGLLKRKRSPERFWTWLAANGSRIQSAGLDDADVVEELSAKFKSAWPDLAWEITPAQDGPWVFCVSADGNFEFFEQVKAAVAAAPAIPGWRIEAFRQRGSLDAVIEMHDRKLSYDDIWCEVEPNGDLDRVTLCVRGLTLETAESLLGAALVLLDNAVGEHDAVVRISDLDNAPLPANPIKSPEFFPLSDLPAYFDRRRQSK